MSTHPGRNILSRFPSLRQTLKVFRLTSYNCCTQCLQILGSDELICVIGAHTADRLRDLETRCFRFADLLLEFCRLTCASSTACRTASTTTGATTGTSSTATSTALRLCRSGRFCLLDCKIKHINIRDGEIDKVSRFGGLGLLTNQMNWIAMRATVT
jgi:hypothetical protein